MKPDPLEYVAALTAEEALASLARFDGNAGCSPTDRAWCRSSAVQQFRRIAQETARREEG